MAEKPFVANNQMKSSHLLAVNIRPAKWIRTRRQGPTTRQ